jgi:ribose transport system ATP-binding protein
MTLTARENLTLPHLRPFWRRLHLGRGKEREAVREWFGKLDVHPADGMEMPLGSFSGGNQQKILFAKWMRQRPRILLLDEPSQGVDVGAKAELHRQVLAAAEGGSSVLIASSEPSELVALCDRVIVFREGGISRVLKGDEVSVREINQSVLGVAREYNGEVTR